MPKIIFCYRNSLPLIGDNVHAHENQAILTLLGIYLKPIVADVMSTPATPLTIRDVGWAPYTHPAYSDNLPICMEIEAIGNTDRVEKLSDPAIKARLKLLVYQELVKTFGAQNPPVGLGDAFIWIKWTQGPHF